VSVEVVEKDWSRPLFDLARDGHAVTAAGRLVGFGLAYADGEHVDVGVAEECQARPDAGRLRRTSPAGTPCSTSPCSPEAGARKSTRAGEEVARFARRRIARSEAAMRDK
jgi:hypothetical protein